MTEDTSGALAHEIEGVQKFWDANPLFTGESNKSPGSEEFFKDHTKACFDMMGGKVPDSFWPRLDSQDPVLDLGCGIGFWLEQFWQRGLRNITGADLSHNSLELAAKRCAILNASVTLSQQNAQAMTFADASFQHVNCAGVIHHSPDPPSSIAEVARVLRPNGTAMISVYYWNVALRAWPLIKPVAELMARSGATLKGRGRESMMSTLSARELVRLYDGSDNPIGLAYSRKQFAEMLKPHFEIERFVGHVFPSRVLPFKLPTALFRGAEAVCPFMIGAVVRKA